MTVYMPVFTRNGWKVEELNHENLNRIGGYIHDKRTGVIYGRTVYSTKQAAESWIRKNYFEAEKYEVEVN